MKFTVWDMPGAIRIAREKIAQSGLGDRVTVAEGNIFNAFSDDDGGGPLYAALDNVYFVTLPAARSMIYPWIRYEEWLAATGFTHTVRHPGDSWTPHGVISAKKPG